MRRRDPRPGIVAVWREEQKPNRQEPNDANARPLNRKLRNTTDKSKTESKRGGVERGARPEFTTKKRRRSKSSNRRPSNKQRRGLEEITPPPLEAPPRASLPARALSVGRRDAVSSDFWRRALTRRCISCLSGVLSGSAKRPSEFHPLLCSTTSKPVLSQVPSF